MFFLRKSFAFQIFVLLFIPGLFAPSVKLSSFLKNINFVKKQLAKLPSFQRSGSLSSTFSSAMNLGGGHGSGLPPSSSNSLRRQQSTAAAAVSGPPHCKCWRQELLSQMILLDEQRQLFVSDDSFIKGSQGRLYHGYSGTMHRCIAMKLVYYADDKELYEMAEQEINSYKHLELNHVGTVVRLLGHFDYPQHGIFVLIMEMGEYSLYDYWQNAEFDSHAEKSEEIRTLMKHILNPLIEMHSVGILHLDLKMKNMMMSKVRRSNGNLQCITKFIDFGGAQFTHSANLDKFIEPTFVVGTPDYLAPEQNISDDYHNLLNSKADIWAVGCVLYEMIIGYSPNTMLFFDAKNKKQLRAMMFQFNSVVQHEVDKWRAGKFEHYQSLLHMVKACLHDDPEARPHAYQLMAFLHGWCKLSISSAYDGILMSYNGLYAGPLECAEMSVDQFKQKIQHNSSLRYKKR